MPPSQTPVIRHWLCHRYGRLWGLTWLIMMRGWEPELASYVIHINSVWAWGTMLSSSGLVKWIVTHTAALLSLSLRNIRTFLEMLFQFCWHLLPRTYVRPAFLASLKLKPNSNPKFSQWNMNWVCLSGILPRIKKICASKHAHISHWKQGIAQ